MSSTKNRLHRALGIDVASHGDLSDTKLDPNVHLQVIALGLSRTGTTSLQAALTRLGFGPCHQGIDLFRSPARTEAFISLDKKLLQGIWKAGDQDLNTHLRSLMRGYRSTTDNPINTLSDEIYAAYPDAKYILTTRPDGRTGWWRSIMEAVGWHFRRDWGRWMFRSLIFPVSFLRRTDDKVQGSRQRWEKQYGAFDADIYDKHNAHIKELVATQQLLVYDVREGWEPLCRFLEVPIPNESYPSINERSQMQAIYVGMMAYGAMTWATYASISVVFGYLAFNPSLIRGLLERSSHFSDNFVK